MQITKMEKAQIEREYSEILMGCSKFEKGIILLLTGALYVVHSKIFLFILYGFFTYPIAIVFYLHGAGEILFGVTALIHFATLEVSCRFWPDRTAEMAKLKEAISVIRNYKEAERDS
jgi:hypothetical protein